MTGCCVRRESAFRKKPRNNGRWEDPASTKSAIISLFGLVLPAKKMLLIMLLRNLAGNHKKFLNFDCAWLVQSPYQAKEI